MILLIFDLQIIYLKIIIHYVLFQFLCHKIMLPIEPHCKKVFMSKSTIFKYQKIPQKIHTCHLLNKANYKSHKIINLTTPLFSSSLSLYYYRNHYFYPLWHNIFRSTWSEFQYMLCLFSKLNKWTKYMFQFQPPHLKWESKICY